MREAQVCICRACEFQRQLAFKALPWIAFAFQPLHLGETFAALTTRMNAVLGIQGRYTEPVEALLESGVELEELCAALLITLPNGLIEFCDADLSRALRRRLYQSHYRPAFH